MVGALPASCTRTTDLCSVLPRHTSQPLPFEAWVSCELVSLPGNSQSPVASEDFPEHSPCARHFTPLPLEGVGHPPWKLRHRQSPTEQRGAQELCTTCPPTLHQSSGQAEHPTASQ